MLVKTHKVGMFTTYISFYDENNKEFLLRFDFFLDGTTKEVECLTRERINGLYYLSRKKGEIELNSKDLIEYVERKEENYKYSGYELKISIAEFEKFLKEYVFNITTIEADDMYFINALLHNEGRYFAC